MKNFILILSALLLFSPGFSQEMRSKMTVTDYRQLSKEQKVIGIILLGAGVTTLAIASQGDISFDDLPTVVILGGLATVGGTTLLIASGNNKRKSQTLSAGLNVKKPFFGNVNYAKSKPIPSISLKVRF